jgi:hypothetical protein
MLTQNPTNARLKYVWEKQKPKLEPVTMMDVIVAVAERVDPSGGWIDKIEAAASRADAKLAQAIGRWRHNDESVVDSDFVTAVLVAINELPEFRKTSPVDGLVPWFAKELDRLQRLTKDPNAPEYGYVYGNVYKRLRQTFGEDKALVEWFEKKRPNLTKLDANELMDAVEAYEEDREPEVVYKFKDGWKIVKLATRRQIQDAGEELRNCLRAGSSHTDNYCRQAETGKSEFFALRNKTDKTIVTIQWSPGEKTPEQVYAADNEEPELEEKRRVSEWATSRGGVYKADRFNLRGSALEIAEFMAEHPSCSLDDEEIESMALSWDEVLSVRDTEKWINALGCYSADAAKVIDDAGLDPEEFNREPKYIQEYILEGNTKDAERLLKAGLLAADMYEAKREPRPERRVPEGQERLPFISFEQKFKETVPEVEVPKSLKLPKGDHTLLEALDWYESGWETHDFDEALAWWKAWFTPAEAVVFVNLSDYERTRLGLRSSSGIPLSMAKKLRERGIDAWDVADALEVVPERVDTRDLDAIVAAVEAAKLKPNRRRRARR